MKKRKPKKRTRTSPRAARAKEMRKQGYLSPEEAAAMGGVAASTVYGWVRRGLLLDIDQRNAALRLNGVLWILAESVRQFCAPVRAG